MNRRLSLPTNRRLDGRLAVVLVIACLTFGTGIHWGLPVASDPETLGPWEMDGVAPVGPLTEAYYKFTREGVQWLIHYPLFHFVLLDIVYAPYLATEYLVGNIEHPSKTFPYGLKNPVDAARNLTLLARLVSLVMALGIIVLVYQISAELFSSEAALWASLMVTFLAPLTYYAKTSNLDVPYLFWTFLALWNYARIIKLQRMRNYIGFAVCAALSVATKDQAYGFYAFASLTLIYALALHRELQRPGFRNLVSAFLTKQILGSLFVALMIYGLANNLFFGGWSGFLRHLAANRAIWEQRPEMSASQLDLILESGSLLVQAMGWGTLLLCLGGISLSIARRQWMALSVGVFPVSYYIFCLALVGVVYPRYLLGPMIVFCLFGGGFVAEMLKNTSRTIRSAALLGGMAAIVWQLVLTCNLTLTLIADSRYQAESWIRSHIPIGSTIESQVALARYLPRISADYKITMIGQDKAHNEFGGEPLVESFTAEALANRNPHYILLGSLGDAYDPENWKDSRLISYREALLAGHLGYVLLKRFDTPHFIPYRQLTGTRPTFVLLGRKSDLGSVTSARR